MADKETNEAKEAPKKPKTKKPKEDPRGTLRTFGNVKLYIKG